MGAFEWDVGGHGDARAVEERAVGGVEVLQHPVVAPEQQSGVVRRGVIIADDQAALPGATDGERLTREG